MEQQYTGKNITKNSGQPYLLKNPDELNILANAVEKHLGLRYTTHMINCHRHHKFFNAVFKSTVNLDFLIFQTKIKKIQRIQQGTNHEGKWKEARWPKKGCLCSTDFQREKSKYRTKKKKK